MGGSVRSTDRVIRSRRRLAVALLLSGSLVLRPGAAGAHTEVQRYEPQPGTEVRAPVDQVRLTFLDPVLPGAAIEVADDAGTPVDGLGPTELGEDRRVATVRFEPLDAPGGYVVDYRFAAEDGDEQRETFRFTVRAAAPATDDDGDATVGARGLVGAAVVGAALAVAIGLAFRRRDRGA